MKTKAIIVKEFGDIKNLKLNEITLHNLKPNEVRIKHTHIAVNHHDVHYIYEKSEYYNEHNIPGIEACGRVEEVGSEVTWLQEGDRVIYGSSQGGAFSYVRNIDANILIKLPDDLRPEQLVGNFTRMMTAQYLTNRTFILKPGLNVMVNGAAGGVGIYIGQFTSKLGLEPIGVVLDQKQAEFARENGFKKIIIAGQESISEAVRKHTNNQGIQVIYDAVGKDLYEESIKSLAYLGILVNFGHVTGNIQIKADELKYKSLFVTSPSLFIYKSNRNELVASANDIFEMVRKEVFEPVIYKETNFQEIPALLMEIKLNRVLGGCLVKL